MSLINCPECKKTISDKAPSCPHCGIPLFKVKNNVKKKRNIPLLLAILLTIFVAYYYYNKIIPNPLRENILNTENNKYSVENVRISKDYSNAWALKGSIRNNSNSSIKGAVKIKFLNSKGDIVHSNRANVNSGDFISPGQAADFDYFVSPEKFKDVVDFEIEFYER